jgi:hypothetical protein
VDIGGNLKLMGAIVAEGGPEEIVWTARFGVGEPFGTQHTFWNGFQ